MLMNDTQLKEAIANGQIQLEGMGDHQMGNVTIDVKLGPTFLIPLPDQVIDVTDPKAEVKYEEFTGAYTLFPGEFVLAVMKEKITLGDQVAGTIYGRSNTSRLGLVISEGPIIDPGFSGYITLELYNQAPYPIVLREDFRIGHIAFQKVNPVEVPYSKKPNNKYAGKQLEMKPVGWKLDKEWKQKEAANDNLQ